MFESILKKPDMSLESIMLDENENVSNAFTRKSKHLLKALSDRMSVIKNTVIFSRKKVESLVSIHNKVITEKTSALSSKDYKNIRVKNIYRITTHTELFELMELIKDVTKKNSIESIEAIIKKLTKQGYKVSNLSNDKDTILTEDNCTITLTEKDTFVGTLEEAGYPKTKIKSLLTDICKFHEDVLTPLPTTLDENIQSVLDKYSTATKETIKKQDKEQAYKTLVTYVNTLHRYLLCIACIELALEAFDCINNNLSKITEVIKIYEPEEKEEPTEPKENDTPVEGDTPDTEVEDGEVEEETPEEEK